MRKLYTCLLLSLCTLSVVAAPAFQENKSYRIACLQYASGGVTPGASHFSSYTLMYYTGNNTDNSLYWNIRSTGNGTYTLYNNATKQYMTYSGTYNEKERYVTLTSNKKGTDSEWAIAYNEKVQCYIISRPDVPEEVLNVRTSRIVGTYKEFDSSYSINEQFVFYDTEGNEVTDATVPAIGNLTDCLSSFKVNGISPVYDEGNKRYMFTVPTEWIETGKGEATANFTWASGYDNSNCSLWLEDRKLTDGSTTVFDNLTAERVYTFQVKQGDVVIAESQLICTQLPIVEINGSFYNVYQEGNIRVTEANGQEATLYKARLKWRGATAMNKYKKSYAVKLLDENGESLDAGFFGLRSDNNWILDAMAIDAGRMRNRVSTDLWNSYATRPYYQEKEPSTLTGTRGQFVEVLLNGSYNGLYCMTEKIDRKQLRLKKYDATSTLAKIRGVLYKSTDWSYSIFMGHSTGSNYYPRRSPSSYTNTTDTWDGWEMKYPDIGDGEQINWAPLYNAVNLVAAGSDDAFQASVGKYFDLPVMMDYYLLIELMKATDNHGKNLYLAAHNINTDTKLTVIPWDMDGTWGRRWDGSTNYCDPEEDFISFLWAHEHGEHTLYKRLHELNPDGWNEALALRYARLRLGAFQEDSLINRFATYTDAFLAGGAGAREIERWNGYDSKDMDFKQELEYISDWILHRLAYLDQQYDIENIDTGIRDAETEGDVILTGGRGKILVKTTQPLNTGLYNLNGQIIKQLNLPAGYTEVEGLPRGMYLLKGKKVMVN